MRPASGIRLAALGVEKILTGWWPANTGEICTDRIRPERGVVGGAHSFILQIFADYGIIVTLVTLALIIYYILIPAGKYLLTKHQDNEPDLYILCSIILSYISIIIISLSILGFFLYPLLPPVPTLCLQSTQVHIQLGPREVMQDPHTFSKRMPPPSLKASAFAYSLR